MEALAKKLILLAAALALTIQVPKPVTILFFGDMMLDRGVRFMMSNKGADYPFRNLEELIRGNDIVFANLEGTITHNTSKTLGVKNAPLIFTFSTTTAPLIRAAGFTLLGLANNHSFNFGKAGLAETKKYLDENGLDYFGDPNNTEHLSIVKEVRGLKIGFVGYHALIDTGYENVLAEIRRLASTTDFLVVVPHWGVEYNTDFTELQQQQAHAFIDAGADLVIGAHPHVVEPVEIYKNKAIFYSLGNFIFDQDFSYNTTHGLAVRLTLTGQEAHYDLIPLSIVKSQPARSSDIDREKILKVAGGREELILQSQ